MTLPGYGNWRPTTEAEEALAAALAARDQLGYCRALAEEALYLPITPGAATGREPVQLATSVAHGVTYVLAWTSGGLLPPEAPAARRAPLFEIIHDIAGRGWGIAVNPGLPLQAFLGPDAVRTLPPYESVWAPLDAALRRAVAVEDRDAYLGALVDGHVVLPLPTEAEIAAAAAPVEEPGGGDYWTAVRTDHFVPSVSRDITDPEFPWWRTERADGEPVICAFTSQAHMQAEAGDRDFIAVPFVDVVVAWPEGGGALRLNPGASNGMELPASALAGMYDLVMAAMHEMHTRRDDQP